MTNKKTCNKLKSKKWKFTLQSEFQEVQKAIVKTPHFKWVWCSKIEIAKNYSQMWSIWRAKCANDYQMGCNVTNTNVGIQCKHYEGQSSSWRYCISSLCANDFQC